VLLSDTSTPLAPAGRRPPKPSLQVWTLFEHERKTGGGTCRHPKRKWGMGPPGGYRVRYEWHWHWQVRSGHGRAGQARPGYQQACTGRCQRIARDSSSLTRPLRLRSDRLRLAGTQRATERHAPKQPRPISPACWLLGLRRVAVHTGSQRRRLPVASSVGDLPRAPFKVHTKGRYGSTVPGAARTLGECGGLRQVTWHHPPEAPPMATSCTTDGALLLARGVDQATSQPRESVAALSGFMFTIHAST
jgi:hypothetical protein